ncbi:hypothetical protein XELAEV_18019802mg [Xenopus laevis]|uniref:Uncharacterized protein n=1 Tax=Xenopus laevis TaxID=8355 RepID=A0A974D5P7_XENLA|nr:hypothetical protein XELAEV_18019802mg [Xenopus laevis]
MYIFYQHSIVALPCSASWCKLGMHSFLNFDSAKLPLLHQDLAALRIQQALAEFRILHQDLPEFRIHQDFAGF